MRKELSSSSNFDPNVIRQAFHGERFDLDIKAKMYKLDSNCRKGEFARDIIAFANTARRTGRPAYIVFGIKDESREYVPGLENQYPGEKKPRGWDAPHVGHAKVMVDGVEMYFRNTARAWIHPSPDLNLQWGFYKEKFFIYLEILPLPTEKPFSLQRTFVKDDKQHQIGDQFIRYGPATQKVTEDLKPFLTTYSVPYLNFQQWKYLFTRHQNDLFKKSYEKIKSFPLYGDRQKRMTAECGQTETGEVFPSFDPQRNDNNLFDTLMKRIDAFSMAPLSSQTQAQIINVSGIAGSGKSTLLRAVAYEMGVSFDHSALSNFPKDIPQIPIPLYVVVREFPNNLGDFKRALKNEIDIQWKGEVEDYFAIPGTRWILMLDGLDELYKWEDFLPTLKGWLKSLPPNVMVFLAARPYIWPPYEPVYMVRPLTPQETRDLLTSHIYQAYATEDDAPDIHAIEEYIEQKVWPYLTSEDGRLLLPLLNTPRAVEALLDKLQIADEEVFLEDLLHVPREMELLQAFATPMASSNSELSAMKISEVDALSSLAFDLEDVVNEESEGTEGATPEEALISEEADSPGVVFPSSPLLLGVEILDYLWWEAEEKKFARIGRWHIERKAMLVARRDLQEIAWHADWETLCFDVTTGFDKKSWFYCERIGVIQPVDKDWRSLKKRFSSHIVRIVEAAYHGEASMRRFWFRWIGWINLRRFRSHTRHVLQILRFIMETEGKQLPIPWRIFYWRFVSQF